MRNLPNASRRRWLLAAAIGLALGAAAFGLAFAGLDWAAIPRAMERLDTTTVLAFSAALPLAGFPISLVYLLIGVRFGPLDGLGVVTVITALHLAGTHWIGRGFLRAPLLRLLERRKLRVPNVPPGENAAVALVVMLAPGVPYFLRNYVLALSGIPLRIYFWVALPVHLLRSYVALFLGDFGNAPSKQGLALLATIYTVKLGLFAAIAWWLRRRHQRLAARAVLPEPPILAGARDQRN